MRWRVKGRLDMQFQTSVVVEADDEQEACDLAEGETWEEPPEWDTGEIDHFWPEEAVEEPEDEEEGDGV